MGLIHILILASLYSLSIQQADDSVGHAKVTSIRNYMNIDRTTITECWYDRDKFCTLSDQIKNIIRKDLGVRYIINLRTGVCKTETLRNETTKASVYVTRDFRYIGQYYTPFYDWNEPEFIKDETSGGYTCRNYVCEGDADFDHISLSFSVANTGDQFLAAMLNSFMTSYGGTGNRRDPLIGMINSNKNLLIVRLNEYVENPIAPPITTRTTIEFLGKVIPEKGLFDLPENFRKGN